MIGCPGRYVSRVFGNQLQIAALDIQSVSVKDFFVPFVETDDQISRVIFQVIDHLRSDTVKRCQVSFAGTIAPAHVKMKVFVPAIIFQVQKIFVSLPGKGPNIPVLDLSDLFRFPARFRLDEDIQPAIDWLQKPDQRSARRELIPGRFGIAEKVPQRNGRRNAVFGGGG